MSQELTVKATSASNCVGPFSTAGGPPVRQKIDSQLKFLEKVSSLVGVSVAVDIYFHSPCDLSPASHQRKTP